MSPMITRRYLKDREKSEKGADPKRRKREKLGDSETIGNHNGKETANEKEEGNSAVK